MHVMDKGKNPTVQTKGNKKTALDQTLKREGMWKTTGRRHIKEKWP